MGELTSEISLSEQVSKKTFPNMYISPVKCKGYQKNFVQMKREIKQNTRANTQNVCVNNMEILKYD